MQNKAISQTHTYIHKNGWNRSTNEVLEQVLISINVLPRYLNLGWSSPSSVRYDALPAVVPHILDRLFPERCHLIHPRRCNVVDSPFMAILGDLRGNLNASSRYCCHPYGGHHPMIAHCSVYCFDMVPIWYIQVHVDLWTFIPPSPHAD